jgi:putative methylase
MINEQILEIILSKLKEHPNPKYFLEQYSITPGIAAHILFLAKKDIKNKVVYDLGCGTGRFAIGAALLGAKVVYGVDIDGDVLKVAKKNAKQADHQSGYHVSKICRWIHSDIRKLKRKVDIVIQFPPFRSDIMFFKKALQLANNVYSIHKASKQTEKKLKEICKNFGVKISKMKKFKYKIEWKEKEKVGREIVIVIVKK